MTPLLAYYLTFWSTLFRPPAKIYYLRHRQQRQYRPPHLDALVP